MLIQEDKSLIKIINKQFEILGEKMTFLDIPESGVVTYKEGKKEKKDYWYNVYKFTEEQQKEWVEWTRNELRKICADEIHLEEVFRMLDLCYGFVIRYKKEGELF